VLCILVKISEALSRSRDGYLLLEQSTINTHRCLWEEGNLRIRWLRRSGRFVTHYDVFGLATRWMAEHGLTDSVHVMDLKDFEIFAKFPETF
jgi:hypothetical protein